MKKYASLLLTLFVGSFCFSQQKTTNNNFIPVSIYTTSFQVNTANTPSYLSLNKSLNFKNHYKKSTISFEENNSEQCIVADRNHSKNATTFIYDDYKNYRDENLLKGFLQKHDPTRWDPSNFRQPNIN